MSRKWRWSQFSIRMLLAFILFASIGLSWFVVQLRRARVQRKAVEAVAQAGGIVTYEGEPFPRGVWQPETPGPMSLRRLLGDDLCNTVVEVHVGGDGLSETLPRLPADTLRHVERLPSLRRLAVVCVELTADDVSRISAIDSLDRLDLGFSEVAREGWPKLQRLSNLTHLDLSGTNVDDAALADIGLLHELERLDLSFTNVTDAGVTHLPDLSQLSVLRLAQCPITNAGLQQLVRLNKLELLDLGGTKITEDGWRHFRLLKSIRELHIPFYSPTEQHIAELESLGSLQVLEIDCATPDNLARLKGRLPNVEVGYDAYGGFGAGPTEFDDIFDG